MATAASIAARRGNVEARIKTLVSALADKHKVELPEVQPYAVRDIELRRVMDLETVADQLDAITASFATKKEEKVEDEVQIMEAKPKGKKK